MASLHSIRGLLALSLLGALAWPAAAQPARPAPPSASGQPAGATYVVFLNSKPLGREEVAVQRTAEGWVIRGSGRIGAPVDVVTRHAEVLYDAEWRARSLAIDGSARGVETTVRTTFADGKASNELSIDGQATKKQDDVAPDTIVLPNAFLGSYTALSHRLVGAAPGASFRAYIAPQSEVSLQVVSLTPEQIETPKQRALSATRATLRLSAPGGDVQLNLWFDAEGTLLRLSVPAQGLEIAREDVSSVATRMTAFSIPGDESVRIPAAGFTLAGSVARPANTAGPFPAIVLVAGSGSVDRDGYVAGIPLMGQFARDLVAAGFLVVRFDKRGVGQSGGRSEAMTLTDAADDVRAVLSWLDDRRDVDDKRIGLVGYDEGAWVAMLVASRDKRVSALALAGAAASTGAELVLEQQRHVLAQLKTPEAEAESKIALQKSINDAVLTGRGWDAVPANLRAQAETPFFQSFLAFDPAKVMRGLDQPVFILHGELDTQVPPSQAERLEALAGERKRQPKTELVIVPGVNHLFVPAKTGEIDEYATLTNASVAPAATSALGTWMTAQLGSGKESRR